MTTRTRTRWHWTRWPLARQLPLITAAIIVLVMVLSLTLTYQALVEARADLLSSRMKGLMSVIVQGAESSARARVALLHQAGTDTTLASAVTAPAGSLSAKDDSVVASVLRKVTVPADSGLPDVRNASSVRRPQLHGKA